MCVLSHSLAGASRSVTIAVAYIMSVTSLNAKEALEAIRGARSISSPNYGFQRQLEEFEIRRLRNERKRMSLKFPQKIAEDEEEVRKLIQVHHNLTNSPEDSDNTMAQNVRSLAPSPVGPSQRMSPSASPLLGSGYRRSPHVQRKLATTLFRENKTL